MIDINEIAETISTLKKNKGVLSLLLEFEEVLDNLHIYAYENWLEGEVIRGPIVSRYWVEVFLMYPESKMPNPAAADRLIKHGCHVFFKKEYITDNVKIKRSSDLVQDPNGRNVQVPKTKKMPVYVVKIVMPRFLLTDNTVRRIGTIDNDINLDEIVAAYDEGLDVERSIGDDDQAEQNQE